MSIRFGRSGNGYDSSQVMETADDDWRQITDLAERRKIQNRLAQRNYRRKLRQRLAELESKAGESTPSSNSSTPSSASSNPPTKKSTAPKAKKPAANAGSRGRTASLSSASARVAKPQNRARANSTRSLCSLPSDRREDFEYIHQQLTPPMSTPTTLSNQSSPNIPAYHNFPYSPNAYYSAEYTPMFIPSSGPATPAIKIDHPAVSSALGIWSTGTDCAPLSPTTCNTTVPEITVSEAAAAELMTRLCQGQQRRQSQPLSSPPLDGSFHQQTEFPSLPSTYISSTPQLAPTSPEMFGNGEWHHPLPSPPMEPKQEPGLEHQQQAAWTLAEVTAAAEMMFPTCTEPMQRSNSWPPQPMIGCGTPDMAGDMWGAW